MMLFNITILRWLSIAIYIFQLFSGKTKTNTGLTADSGIKFKRPEVKPLAIEYVKYFFSKHVRKNI